VSAGAHASAAKPAPPAQDVPPLLGLAPNAAFRAIFDGLWNDAEIAAYLIALSDRGETPQEIAAAAAELRARMLPVEAPPGAIDVCGTGGDGAHTLNVSTAVAIVVAACGAPVAKHGNRAASSRCGAADVLGALGLDLNQTPARAEACLAEVGIAFLFAPNHHPAMARVAPIRRALGRRTVFNLVGPLANPAAVRRQLVGVFAPAWVERTAEALRLLEAERALVVHGREGLDELSPGGPTHVAWLDDDRVTILPDFEPEAAELRRWPAGALAGGDAAHNAAALTALLQGARGAYRDAVLLNAAAALIVAGSVSGLAEGAARAAQAVDSGAARDLLARWVAFR
jgi:anthranilate phosphoribosyltransferase